jgi:DNA repair photolyase
MGEHHKPIRGTAEWAVATVDCCTGCPHGCRYCYARYDFVERRRLVSEEQWQTCTVDDHEVAKAHPLYAGQVMFPAHHDIVPENLAACRTVLLNLLQAGNRVLVVSKPHLLCIEELCREFRPYRDRLLFRFTITARNAEILKFWEPRAPAYNERKSCLELAFRAGFATSVSIEPMLDSSDVVAMVDELQTFVTHSLWLGKMNEIDERVVCATSETQVEIERIQREQDDAHLHEIYRQLHKRPLIRWKESMKTVLGLDLASEPGLDI